MIKNIKIKIMNLQTIDNKINEKLLYIKVVLQ